MKKTTFIAGLFACIFSIGCLHAQDNKYTKENNPVRKLQLAQFAITNLYVDQVDDNKLVESA
ncbi:MAG: peptidase S41, partial [Bacteroidaceae bacterium]|nr:peptidase S41 [Bacteroidaceae bacterium]